ncbi:hypothetical protein scyTo_0010106 [Scyliorhinus torazame]|nr:hypothetical protein [Scyliorhinus torazame]
MSRPLLGLILLNEKYFGELRSNLISNQGLEQQQTLNACFEKLMEGVEQNLLIKNRDRFTQNMSVFKRDVTEILRISTAANTPVGTVYMMS